MYDRARGTFKTQHFQVFLDYSQIKMNLLQYILYINLQVILPK